MAEDYVLQTKITADSTEFQKNLEQAQKSIKKFSTDLQSAIGLLGNLFVVSTMKNFAKTAIGSVQETNKKLKLLDATLKTTGADAWTSQNKLLGMAQEFEKSSNYSKELIMEMQTVLLGFKSVTNDVFESASQEIINMATVMGMDLKSAVQTVGKALDDPIAGLGSLSRQGFVFDESQKQLLKTMVAVGDKASAQKIILEELATTYGGASEASVDSFRELELSLGDLQSAIGEVLIPMASELADKVTTLVNVFNSFSQGTKTAIVTVTGLVTVLPLVVKGLGAVKGAVLALKAANPVLLGVSAAVAGILLAVGKVASVITSTQSTATELNDKTEQLLGTYSKGNESKKLDAKTTQELIKLYPELSGKVEAYATTVKEAAEMQKKLNDEKIVTEAQAKISEIDTLANKYQWWKSQVEDVEKSITELQNAIQQSPKSGLNVDRQRQIEAYKNRLLDLQVGMETAKNKVDEKVSEINKSLATVGKTLQGRSIVNLPEIEEQIDSDLSNVADSAKKSWRQVLADVLSVDIKLFNTGKEASRLYIKGIESELSLNKDIAKALGDLFNPKDELEKQAKDIKERIGKILSEKNVDIPFSLAELTKQGTALGDLATKYKSLTATIKSLNIDEEIKDLQEQVANLGKSEIEVYKAKLKTNGATDEQIKKAVELKEKLINANKSTSKSFSDLKDEIKKDAEDWSDVAKTAYSSITGAGDEMFVMLGENLAGAGHGYEDFASTAVEALSEVLKGLAAQITALGVTHALAMDFAGAALAAAGAAAALVAAGTLKAVASNLKQTSTAAKEATNSIDDFIKRLQNIKETRFTEIGTFSQGVVEYSAEIANAIKNMDEAYAKYDELRNKDIARKPYQYGYTNYIKWLKEVEDAQENYLAWVDKVSEANIGLSKSLTELVQNSKDTVDENSAITSSYRELYNSINKVSELQKQLSASDNAEYAMIKSGFAVGDITKTIRFQYEKYNSYLKTLKNNIKAQVQELENSVYESMLSVGKDIGETFISSIVDGATKTDFMSSIRDYIKKQMIQLAILTDDFSDRISNIGVKLLSAMTTGDSATKTSSLKLIATELESLYTEMTAKANDVEEILTSVFGKVKEELSQNATTIGDTLMRNILNGAKESDFLSSMKSYIKESVLKVAIYSSTLTDKITSIGEKLSQAVLSGSKSQIKSLKTQLSSLYKTTVTQVKGVLSIIDEVFPDTSETVSETVDEIEESLTSFEKAMESFNDSVKDIGGDIASNLVNGITNGLSQSDFLSNMKDWLRKMLVQSVVYTETMKAEIEEIGKRISEGITTGFTDTSLHEIRRDLSYIFESASSKMSNIDSILNSVFDGYASGTESATRGLHIVGEAGPELVRFRGGERVYNNRDTMGIISGNKTNNFNVTFNNLRDTSAFAMMNQLKRYNRELAVNGVI